MKEIYLEVGDLIAQMRGYELDEETEEWKPVHILVRFGMPVTIVPLTS